MKDHAGADGLTQLVEIGRQRGYLTDDEVRDLLPEATSGQGGLDHALQALDDQQIPVVRDERGARSMLQRRFAEEIERQGSVPAAAPAGTLRSPDPTRAYLRHMGSVALLSRDGEIQLARRIEEAQLDLVRSLFSTGLGLRRLSALDPTPRRLRRECIADELSEEQCRRFAALREHFLERDQERDALPAGGRSA